MSHILLTRRLGDIAIRHVPEGWRRPAPCLLSSIENMYLQKPTTSPVPLLPIFHSSFSSAASNRKHAVKDKSKATILELPPNLKFDPTCVSSPFYGMEKISPSGNRQKGERNEKAVPIQIEPTANAQSTKGSHGEDEETSVAPKADFSQSEYEEDSVDDDDDEDAHERILYDLTTKPDTPRAVPLPQRLHVPIMDLRTAETVGTIHLSEHTFGCDPVRIDILHRVVVYQRNKKRGRRNAGARTKTVSEVSGSGRKVRQQKGSGKARAGHSRPAHWRGGAKAHGPKGRIQVYTTKLNKKVRKMGVRHALSQKLKEGNLIITADMSAPTHKTKELNQMLETFNVSGETGATALMIDDSDPKEAENEASVYGGLNVNFKVASGNMPKIKVLNQLGCNVYDILKFQKIFLSLAAVRSLEGRLEKDL